VVTAAWAVVGLTLALHVCSTLLVVLGRDVHTPGDTDHNLGAVGFAIAFLAFPLVGALVVTRRPRNAIGWLFLVIGLGFAASNLSSTYADYTLYADPGALPAGVWAAWATSWMDPLAFASIMLLFLLFPDGALLSRSWRPVLWLVLTIGAAALLWNAVKPGEIFQDSLPVENPAGIAWLDAHLTFVDQVVFLGFVAGIVLSVAAAVLRFRRSRGIERDRMKWLAYAALLLVVSFALAMLSSAVSQSRLGDLVIGLGFAAVPIAVGIGVLRYRLYDIDRVISRTLSFTLVTLALGAAYIGLVLAGQAVFSSFAGGSDLAIAVSTLAVAALFLPLRRRVQRFIDRRFDRRRYDAERTLESFGARLREQVDLDELAHELIQVVSSTMQPEHVSVWVGRTRS
jgi:hypothetical protein